MTGIFSGNAGRNLLNELARGSSGTMPACEFVDIDVQIYNLATVGKIDEARALFEKILRPAGVTPARVSTVPLTEAIIEMVKAGLGISALARWAVEEQIAAGKIAARSLTSKGLHRQWQAATIKQDSTPAYFNEFIALLSSPAMPLMKPGIVRFASGKR